MNPTLLPAVNADLLAAVAAPGPGWRYPTYRDALAPGARRPLLPSRPWQRAWRGLLAASYVEWRYFSVIAPTFHGIVGLALVNPESRLPALTEGGLLVIVAGALDPPAGPNGPQPGDAAGELCWMHLFPTAACRFDEPGPGGVVAEHGGCRLTLTHAEAARVEVRLDAPGLSLAMTHAGLDGMALAPVAGTDLAQIPGAHWLVQCPSPVAATGGELTLTPALVAALGRPGPGDGPSRLAPAPRRVLAGGTSLSLRWDAASGYYEHSFGCQPLPLAGWDFLFVPDAVQGQGLVLQTYRGSRALRYVEVCWHQDGVPRHRRFDAAAMSLGWPEHRFDPALGVRRPLARRIEAEAAGLRLRVDARLRGQVPLLRPARAVIRHFFIAEELGVADWSLTDASGRVLAGATGAPCGGELAHFRWRTPTPA